MRYLLDTHVVLWWYLDLPKLERRHKQIIADNGNELYVSAAAIWEIEVKRRNGKLDCPIDMMERIKADANPQRSIRPPHGLPVHRRKNPSDFLRPQGQCVF